MKPLSKDLSFKALLAKRGLKLTRQREMIVKAFLATKDHMDIETLTKKIRHKYPRIGAATVYRTMHFLKEAGIASERHFGTRYAVYEPLFPHQHHDHLICLSCQEIIEFENPEIEILQDKVAKKYRYTLETHKHELYGYCSNCR